MNSPDASATEATTEPDAAFHNFLVAALASQTEALAVAEIEDRLERLVREREIETPLTKPRDAKRVAESTFQAVAYVLRQYGMRRLNDPWLTTRLAVFSDAQITELVAALGRMQPRYPAITNQLIAEITTLRGDL